TVWGGASSRMVRLEMGSRVGGSFTGRTVSRKVVLLVTPSGSATLTVMSAVPDWSGAGWILTVRLLPVPPKLRDGTSVRFEDVPLRRSAPAGVSGSPMVKLILVGVSS